MDNIRVEYGKMMKQDRTNTVLENTLSPGNEMGELFDPTQIINELTYRLHQHSKSSLGQDFQPFVKTQRPTILVEGEEYKEEDSGVIHFKILHLNLGIALHKFVMLCTATE